MAAECGNAEKVTVASSVKTFLFTQVVGLSPGAAAGLAMPWIVETRPGAWLAEEMSLNPSSAALLVNLSVDLGLLRKTPSGHEVAPPRCKKCWFLLAERAIPSETV